MKVDQISFGDSRAKQYFIDFPFNLYRDSNYWVPPFISDMKLIFDRKKHPFYQHSEAAFFLVRSENQVIGRLAAIHNINYAKYHQKPIGFFYFFDSINDQKVANLLFDSALDWFKKRGVKIIIGPKGFLRSNGIGILTQGFDYLPAVGIPYNYPYYDTLIKNYGFQKSTDYFSGYLYAKNMLPDKLHLVAYKVKERGNFHVLTFTSKKEIDPWIDKLDEVHHKSFHKNPNYYPSTSSEFKLMANSIKKIANPKLIKFILKEDQLAGFVITYPNISRAIQQTNGRMFPFGWFTLLKAMKNTELMDINGVGLLPEYQGRGANALLYSELEKTLRGINVKKAELVQIDEQNFLSKSDMEMLGVKWCKTHRMYQLEIPE